VGNNPLNKDALYATKMVDGVKDLITKVTGLEDRLAECFTAHTDSENSAHSNGLNGTHTGMNGKATHTTISSASRKALVVDHPARIASSTLALQQYVRTEAQCLSLLASRVINLTGQLVHLRREHAAYKSLNMTALATDVETSIKKMENDLSEDKKALAHLQECLTGAIARFKSCLNLTTQGVSCYTVLYYLV
jgi:hypothetical protein